MDIYDLYDDHGNMVGECAPRNTPLPRNRNILTVHIYIQNDDGLYLIQKRSLRKDIFPGLWDVTMGAVKRGESSIQGAIRETEEELGLKLEEGEMEYLGRRLNHPALWDVWLARTKFRAEDCRLQPTEVLEIRMVTKSEMLRVFKEQRHRPQEYLDKLKELLPE